MVNFNDDLKEELKDPESAAYFANAQAESAKELLGCGIINQLDETSLSNKTYTQTIEEGMIETYIQTEVGLDWTSLKKPKANILIDLDGVICAYDFPSIVKDYFGVELNGNIYAYDLADVLGVSNEDIDNMFQEQVYGEPNFIEGAIETLHEWVSKGYNIYIYSNRTKYMGVEGLMVWLSQYRIPFIDIVEVVDKTYDYHIDDCPAKLMKADATHKLLFNQPWNSRCFDVKKALVRVNSWKEIREII